MFREKGIGQVLKKLISTFFLIFEHFESSLSLSSEGEEEEKGQGNLSFAFEKKNWNKYPSHKQGLMSRYFSEKSCPSFNEKERNEKSNQNERRNYLEQKHVQ